MGGAEGWDKDGLRVAVVEGTTARAMKGSLRKKLERPMPPSVMPLARMAGRGFGGGSGWLKRLLSPPRLDSQVLSEDMSFRRRLWPDFLHQNNIEGGGKRKMR